MNQNVSPEQASADLVTLETKPSEEGSGAPTQASQPDPTDSGLHEVCVTPSSYVRVSLNDPGLQRRHTHAALVTGSVMRTYYIIDSTGAEIDVEESLNRPPQEIPALEPNAMLPEDDVALSERDQYEYPASGKNMTYIRHNEVMYT